MIYAVLIQIFIVLLILYYGSVIAHIVGITKISKKNKLKKKAVIPFYYWFVS